MNGTLVDSNVILDILTGDAVWSDWSSASLAKCANEGVLCINPLILAKVSIGFATFEELQVAMPESSFRNLPIPAEAAFLAGKVFLRYRRQGGIRTTTLPDFFIGAHAAVSGLTLLTRDVKRYRTYFPTVILIAPGA